MLVETTATPEHVEAAVRTLNERVPRDPDSWPRQTPGGFYPPESAKDDLINWVRSGDRTSYRGVRSRIRKAIIDGDTWIVDQFRSVLRLDESFIDRVYDTHHADGYDPTLREDFIRHLLTLP